jgi:hypothetical protein
MSNCKCFSLATMIEINFDWEQDSYLQLLIHR